MLPIYLLSAPTIEDWSWENPWDPGIGGSETGHIEMALRLAKRDHIVISHCPLPHDKHAVRHGDVAWFDIRKTDFPKDTSAVVLNYRAPHLFDREKPPNQKWWFVAQDVDYTWTERAMLNVDRYITLCHTHSQYTLSKYPFLRNGKVFLSSNGIRTDYINELLPLERKPYRLFWASSPDRGLVCLLENWFRIRERFPEAELRIAYGFNNMDTIIRAQGTHSSLIPLRQELASLGDQPGVTWLGRLGQDRVFEEWGQAATFAYPSDWPETSPLVGTTLIETLQGQVQIKDLVGKETYVYSCNKEGALSISRAWGCEVKRKNAETVTLTYRRGRGSLSGKDIKLTLTPDHEVMLSSGEYRQAGNLKPGDSIKAFTRRKGEYGNGYDTIGITGTPYQPEHRFVASVFAKRPLLPGEVVDHWDENKRNNHPRNLVIHPSQSDHVKSHYARMSSEEYLDLCKRKSEEQKRFWDGLDKDAKARRARNIVEGRWGEAANHKITKVESGPREDVYCMQSDPDHNFIANELVVHNCISIMEAMACGAIPVTSNHWAEGQHGSNCPLGYVSDGLPQKSELAKCMWLSNLYEVLEKSGRGEFDVDEGNEIVHMTPRIRMMNWAREQFNWERIVTQWENWVREDSEAILVNR